MTDELKPPGTTENGKGTDKTEELIENLTPEEKKKWSEKFLQLEYYKAISKTVLQVFKDFSKWTTLLISGFGTLIGGFYSIRKATRKDKIELNKLETQANKAGKQSSTLSERDVHVRRSSSISKENKKQQYEEGVARIEKQEVSQLVASTKEVAPIEMQEGFHMDSTFLLTIASIVLFIAMNIKMFIFDRKKKGVS